MGENEPHATITMGILVWVGERSLCRGKVYDALITGGGVDGVDSVFAVPSRVASTASIDG